MRAPENSENDAHLPLEGSAVLMRLVMCNLCAMAVRARGTPVSSSREKAASGNPSCRPRCDAGGSEASDFS